MWLSPRAQQECIWAASPRPRGEVVRWLRSGNAPADFLVGVSCHSLEEVREAENAGASYAFFGPVFDTPAKRAFGAPQGMARLEEVCRSVKIPVIAIGGVNEENAEECFRAGAVGNRSDSAFSAGGIAAKRTRRRRVVASSLAEMTLIARLAAKPVAHGLPAFHVVANNLDHRRDGNRQNQPHRSPEPSPEKQRYRQRQRIQPHAPANQRGNQAGSPQ